MGLSVGLNDTLAVVGGWDQFPTREHFSLSLILTGGSLTDPDSW